VRSVLWLAALAACGDPREERLPVVSDPAFVVPDGPLPSEIVEQDSNNNLSVVRHDDRLFLAWRTAPSHFASPDTMMYVVSSADAGATWDFETAIALGTDVREPQLVSFDGTLRLFFATLGKDATDFTPQGARVSVRQDQGRWTEPVPAFDDADFMPWRMKILDGKPSMLGYTGGANIYDADGEPIVIHWRTSTDGEKWSEYVPGHDVVLSGGGSETDLAFLADGSIVAVVRNEAGDSDGFGSKICTAPADDLGTWTCATDVRKFDSPLVFRKGNDVWLVARRNVTDTGAYDLQGGGDMAAQYYRNSIDYWQRPKRCSLWKVDPDTRTVAFVQDLPGRGDTCFPDAVDNEDGSIELFNYTSPLDGDDLSWIAGQEGLTSIYRVHVDFPE
jgi:hypothetical protein